MGLKSPHETDDTFLLGNVRGNYMFTLQHITIKSSCTKEQIEQNLFSRLNSDKNYMENGRN